MAFLHVEQLAMSLRQNGRAARRRCHRALVRRHQLSPNDACRTGGIWAFNIRSNAQCENRCARAVAPTAHNYGDNEMHTPVMRALMGSLVHKPALGSQKCGGSKPHAPTVVSPTAAPSTVVFFTTLGWMGLLARGGRLAHLVFGHASASDAHAALAEHLARAEPVSPWRTDLVDRLRAYAQGAIDEFADVELDLGPLTPFRRRVVDCLRRVPYGATLTYGELAALAGHPGAARAVGTCMSCNPVPIIVPCHRVLAAGGKLGGYSAPSGLAMKKRLLALERNAARGRVRQRASAITAPVP